MKKSLLSLCAIALLIACEKDTPAPTSSYPTDGLTLKQEQKLILHVKGSLGTSNTASFSALQQLIGGTYGSNIVTTSSFEMGELLHTEYSDTLANQLKASMPGIYIKGENAITWDEERIEKELAREPLLAVAHRGGENDTAYYTDVKVKFFRDTSSTVIYVNSFLLSDFKATDDGMLNLTLPPFNGIVKNVGDQTVYDNDFYNADSSVVIKKGDAYMHRDVALAANPHIFSRGINLALDINPFAQEFYEGDILGTEFTPIRIYIRKPQTLDPLVEEKISPKFLTIVWTADFENGGYKILNCYKGR